MLIRTRSYWPTGSLSQTFEDFYFEKEKRGRPPCPPLGVYQVHRAQACDAVLLTGRRGRCAAALEMSARSERDSWSQVPETAFHWRPAVPAYDGDTTPAERNG